MFSQFSIFLSHITRHRFHFSDTLPPIRLIFWLYKVKVKCNIALPRWRTQWRPTSFPGSLSTASLFVGRKTLVAACDTIWVVKTLLGGKVGRVFWLLLWQTLWVSKPQAVGNNYPLYRVFETNFADEECFIISAVSKVEKSFVHKEIWQPNGAGNFWQLPHVKRHFQKSKPWN